MAEAFPNFSSAPSTTTLLKKPNSTSIIWNYFGLKPDKDGKAVDDGRPYCRRCNTAIHAKGGNTSNLLKHLQCCHPDLALECSQRKLANEVSMALFVITSSVLAIS